MAGLSRSKRNQASSPNFGSFCPAKQAPFPDREDRHDPSQSPSRNLAMSGPSRLEKSSLQGCSPAAGVCNSQSFSRPKSSSFLAKIITVENLIIGSPPETSSSSYSLAISFS